MGMNTLPLSCWEQRKIKENRLAWVPRPVWLSWLEHYPVNREVAGLIPGWCTYERQPTDVSLPSPLFKINKHVLR